MKKSDTKYNWLTRGLNPNDFEKAWAAHCTSICCDWCRNDYKSSRDKQMDHCHQDDDYYEKGDFRNILCRKCNNWRNISKNISKSWDNKENKYYYYVRVYRNGKYILNTKRNTLEKAQELLLDFKRNNVFYFPFWYE